MSYLRHKMVVLIRIRDKLKDSKALSYVLCPLDVRYFFGNLMYRCSKYAEGRKTLAILVILWEKVHNFINFYGHTDSNKAFSFFCNHWLHDIFTHQCWHDQLCNLDGFCKFTLGIVLQLYKKNLGKLWVHYF